MNYVKDKTGNLEKEVKRLTEINDQLNKRIVDLERENLELWEVVDDVATEVLKSSKKVGS